MGVDCKILLPAAARLRDVADVMGALAGFPMHKKHFNPPSSGWSAGREYGDKGVEIKPCGGTLESCAMIHLNNTADCQIIDGQAGHYVMYHFEGSRKGERLLNPPSTDFWIAIGKGLVDFFGGRVDFNDCDDIDVDYEQPERDDIHAEDDDEWYALQNRKLAVKALTKANLKACREVAACK